MYGASEYQEDQQRLEALQDELEVIKQDSGRLTQELVAFKEQAREDQIRSQAMFNEISSLKESIERLSYTNSDDQKALFVVEKFLKNVPLTMEEKQIKQNAYSLGAQDDEASAEILLLRGIKSFEEKDFDQASAYFEQVLEEDEQQGIALWGLGRILFAKREFAEAKSAYSEALEQAQRSIKAGILVDRGLTWVRLHSDENPSLDQALNDYNDAISLGNNFPSVYRRRGLIHLRLGAINQAKADFERAVSSSSNDQELASAIENKALVSLHENQWEEAIGHSKLVLRVYPKSEWNWAIRTIAASKAGYPDVMICSLSQWFANGGNKLSSLRYYLSSDTWTFFTQLVDKHQNNAASLCEESLS
uniref:tetratricopeptide repeat protein n=1 Tax=Ningiella ruwaisensis TaxID=2364274 RepID=UPI00109FB403|nr:tetratricopeptide repeat protein [Ningiella ruwaisensis]